MDERELRNYYRAAQPVLQRTAPIPSASRSPITPVVLDQIAWSVVLAYVANTSREMPRVIPSQAQSGEAPLRDEDVRAAVEGLKQNTVRPRLEPKAACLDRFGAAVRRLLDAYGWAPQRASQAANEVTKSLAAMTRRG